MATLFHAPKLQFVNTTCVKANVEDHAFNVGEAFKKMTNLSNDVTIIGKDGGENKVNRLLLGVFSQMLRPIIFDQLNSVPTIILPDVSSNSIRHLINMITVGSSASHSIAFKELHEITEAAKTLEIDLTDIDWNLIKQKRKFSTLQQEEDYDASRIVKGNEASKDERIPKIIEKVNQDYEVDDNTSIKTTPANLKDTNSVMNDDVSMENYDFTVLKDQIDESEDQTIVNIQAIAKNDQAVAKNDQTFVKNDQPIIKNNRTEQPEQLVVKDEQNIVKDEQNIVKDEQNIVKDEQNIVKDEQNVVKDEQNVVKDEQNVVKDEQTVFKDEQPLVNDESEYQTIVNDQPLVDGQGQSFDKNIQAVAMYDQTIVKNDQPVIKNNGTEESEQPIVMDEQLIVMDEQPIVMDEQPIVMNLQPVVMDEQPIAMDEQPIVMNLQPITMDEQPIAMDEQPIVMNEQPVVMNEQPVVMDEQPIVMDEQPIVMDEQPTVLDEQTDVKDDNIIVPNKKVQDNLLYDQIMEVYDDKQNITLERTEIENDAKHGYDKQIFDGEIDPNLAESSKNIFNFQHEDEIEKVDHFNVSDNQSTETVENEQPSNNSNYMYENQIKIRHDSYNSYDNQDNIGSPKYPVDQEKSAEIHKEHNNSTDSLDKFDASSEALTEDGETSIDNDNESESLKTTCQVCSKVELNYTTLKSHYIGSHFSAKLKSQFGDLIMKKTCVVCSKSFSTMIAAIRHIGIWHNKLNEVLVLNGLSALPDTSKLGAFKRKSDKLDALNKKMKIEPSVNTESLLADSDDWAEMEKKVITETNDKELNDDLDIFKTKEIDLKYKPSINTSAIANIEQDLKRICQICSKNEKMFNLLLNHYCNDHFSKQLNEDYGDLVIDNVCLLCSKKFANQSAVFRHVGVSHGRLNEMLLAKDLQALPLPQKGDTKMNSEIIDEAERDKQNFEKSLLKNNGNEKQQIESIEENTVNAFDEEIRQGEDQNEQIEMPNTTEDKNVLTQFADDTVCQICQKVENPGIFLWNHYLNSHYSKRIGQQFASFVNKKKCLLCNRKLSGSAAALKHVAVKHEKLNDLILLDGLAPLPSIAPKASQDVQFENIDIGLKHTESIGKLKPLVKNFDYENPLNTKDESKPFIRNLDRVAPYESNTSNRLELPKKIPADNSNISSESLFSNQNIMVENSKENLVEIPQYPHNSTYNEENEMEDEENDPLTCQVCNLKKSTITLLQHHYINIHYTRKLKDRFEHLIAGNYCNDCDIKFKSVIKGLVHLGIEHQKLNEILDEEGFLVLIPEKQEEPVLTNNITSLNSQNDYTNYAIEATHSVDKGKLTTKEDYIGMENKIQNIRVGGMADTAVEERGKLMNNPLAKFACDICDEKYEKKSNFIRHTLSNRHYFTCDNCETNFRKKDKFESHKSDCLPVKKLNPNVLENAASSNSNIDFKDKIIPNEPVKKIKATDRRNSNIESNQKLLNEPIATNFNSNESNDKIMSNKTAMKIKADHTTTTDQIIKTKAESRRAVTEIGCEICGEKFDNKKSFFRHCLMKNHYFTCDTCGKSFKKRVEFTAHQKNCTVMN